MANQAGIFHRLVTDQRAELIKCNIQGLRQVHNLLQNIDDRPYAAVFPHIQMQSVSRYTQALLDLYECFLAGLSSGCIDYNSPDQQAYINGKATRQATIERITAIMFRLPSCAETSEDASLWIRPLGSGPRQFQPLMVSSMNRELDFLCSQAVHGLALIVIAVQLAGAARKSDPGACAA